jgi:hypothetical protein
MAAQTIKKACAAESYKAQQEGATSSAHAAELEAFDRVPGRPKPSWVSGRLAPVISMQNEENPYEHGRGF